MTLSLVGLTVLCLYATVTEDHLFFKLGEIMENVITPYSPCVPKLERDKSEGRFYKFSTSSSFRFYAYSAFYDDRLSLLSDPVIRIIAISDDFVKFKNITPSFEMICVLIHVHGTMRVKMEAQPLPCGPGSSLNGKDAMPYVYTCPASGIVPHFLRIETTNSGPGVTSCMPIEFPRKRRKPKSFAVCVPVSYGNLDPYHLIEWLELQRMLGVEFLSVYNLYLGSEALKAFQHYAESDKFVQMRKMDKIYSFEYNAHILELAVSLNDCLYRNMYRVKRIMVADVDEFIKPLKHQNLAQLVGFLERTLTFNRSVNYVIRNDYYFLELEPDATISKYFKILRYRKKADVSPPLHRVKPIIVTMSCTHMFSHLCLGLTARYSNRELFESIDPDIALNQHYRLCPLTPTECSDAMANATQDDAMLVYYDALRAKVKSKIEAIMGNVGPTNRFIGNI